jgi:type 1 glutamine amidotransferase
MEKYMRPHDFSRRTILLAAAAIAARPLWSWADAVPGNGKKILFFTRSQDFPHSVITRAAEKQLAFAEKILSDLATKAGYEMTVSKDGTIFDSDRMKEFDGFVFYTTGDLTLPPGTKYKSDQTPPMSQAGKQAILAAVQGGKGFMGLHCASDTFHSKDRTRLIRPANPDDSIDPYIVMLGGEFLAHQSQQKATIRVAAHDFPGLEDLKDFELFEEWYGLGNLAPDMEVILIQDTSTMKVDPATGLREKPYQRDPYPETWARLHGKGRVFYSSMGHRDDVWTSDLYHKILLAGLAWTSGNVEAKITPNLAAACPQLVAGQKL